MGMLELTTIPITSVRTKIGNKVVVPATSVSTPERDSNVVYESGSVMGGSG